MDINASICKKAYKWALFKNKDCLKMMAEKKQLIQKIVMNTKITKWFNKYIF